MSRGRSLVLDRQYKGVGRLKRATGTDDPKLFRLLDSMCDTLYRAGRIDILQAIQQGRLTPLVVWSRYRLGELAQLPTAESMRPLADAMETWVNESDTGHWNRTSRRHGVRQLLRSARRDATLEELPDLLRDYSRTAAGATMFNRTKAHCQAFVRQTLGRSHPIYAKLRDIESKRTRPRMGNSQSPAQLRALTDTMEPGFAAIAWTMALTGMLPGEFWGKWIAYADHVHIEGTKRKGRIRDVPLVGLYASHPTRGYRKFAKALTKASGGAVLVKDLRNTFAHWMEEARISRIRRKLYLGHRVGDVTDIYERHEMERFWLEDADRLRSYLILAEQSPVRNTAIVENGHLSVTGSTHSRGGTRTPDPVINSHVVQSPPSDLGGTSSDTDGLNTPEDARRSHDSRPT